MPIACTQAGLNEGSVSGVWTVSAGGCFKGQVLLAQSQMGYSLGEEAGFALPDPLISQEMLKALYFLCKTSKFSSFGHLM